MESSGPSERALDAPTKRALDAQDTPGSREKRTRHEITPTTGARPHGRVVLDVGGARFVSSKTTLEAASWYFSSLLTRWDEHNEQPLFIDADADAFQELLSFMRSGTLMLPKDNERLCCRVLLQAEYFGMDALLDEVKAQAFANLHPETHPADKRPLARAFDEDVGTLAEAIRAKVLPARYFAPAPKPPQPAARVIKRLWPAAPGYRALFTCGAFDYGETREVGDRDARADNETLPIVSWALVEYADGAQCVDAVVQPDLDSTRRSDAIERDVAHPQSKSHLYLASEHEPADFDSDAAALHWLVVPPRPPGQMLPIPAGSVRGLWLQPAITNKDKGKRLTISGNTILVDGKERHVEWSDDVSPENVSDCLIQDVKSWADEVGTYVLIEGSMGKRRIEVPRVANGERMEVDLAFADVESGGSEKQTSFYMPLHEKDMWSGPISKLVKATDACFGELRFSHFIGAKRS